MPLLAFNPPCYKINEPTYRPPYAGVLYYFSTSDGDDSRSAAQAQNSATPWKTLNKLNSIQGTLVSGDGVRLKRGNVFEGQITIGKAGILYDAYGSGANPIVSGFWTASTWTDQGGGRFSTIVPSGATTTGVVYMDNVFKEMGRMPKNGYYNINTGSATNLTSTSTTGNNPNSFASAPNCVGGEVVWRPFHWVLWRGLISSQTSTSLNFTGFPSVSGGPVWSTTIKSSNYGFFLQNHPSTCTQVGEWAYNVSSKTLTMFFGGAGPSGHVVKISIVSSLVTNSGFSSVTFKNIAFVGANTNWFNLVSATNNTIDHCQMGGSGTYGVFANGNSDNLTVSNCYMDRAGSNCIKFSEDADGGICISDTISNTGAVVGMGGSGEGQYFGIQDIKNNGIVRRCRITNTGYIPVSFQKNNNRIDSNYIDTFCTVKDDGGGIYHGGNPVTGSIVADNIVMNGVGRPQGTPDPENRAHAYYIDDGGNGSTWLRNTGAHCGDAGLFTHNGFDLVIQNNTFFDCKVSSIRHYDEKSLSANIVQTGNIFFAKTSTEMCLVSSGGTKEPKTFYSSSNNNHWCRPIAETQTISQSAPTSHSFTLAQWKTFSGLDASSTVTPVTVTNVNDIRFETNQTNSTASISLSGNNYTDALGAGYSGTLNLPAWQSRVLIKTAGTGNVFPTVNAGADVTIVSPANSITTSPTYGDADGTVTTFLWTKTSGPSSFTIVSPNAAVTVINGLGTGVYTFTLTVTDNAGGSTSNDMQVTVTGASNLPPSVNAGTDIPITAPTSVANLVGTFSDPDGSVDSVRWTQVSGPMAATIVNPTSGTTNVTGMTTVGQYKFRLTAYDNHGANNFDEITVIVNPLINLPKFGFRFFLYSLKQNGDSLIWGVQNDKDIIRYEIERSADNVSWSKIGTTTPSQLAYFDPFPSTTICVRKWWFFCVQKKTVYTTIHSYYRIKAIDNKAAFFYTSIIHT